MSTDRTIENPNYLYPNAFQLNIVELPQVSYYCNSVNIPGFSNANVIASYRGLEHKAQSDTVIYNPLTITFNVDEDLQNWLELYKWSAEAKQEGYDSGKSGVLTILSNKNNSNIKIEFFNMLLEDLDDVLLDDKITDIDTIPASATFVFDSMKINGVEYFL